MWKKIIIVGLLVTALCWTIAVIENANTSPAIVVEIVPSTDSASPGEQFYVNVTISGIEESHDLVGIEFQIKWNTSLLAAISMEMPSGHIFQAAEDDGNLWVVKCTVNDSSYPDTAWYFVTCSDLDQGYTNGYLPLTGSGVIAKITFNATEELVGNSTIYFSTLPPTYEHTIKLSNGQGQQITDYITNDSQVEVIPEFSSVILYLFLATSLITIALHKKLSKKCHAIIS